MSETVKCSNCETEFPDHKINLHEVNIIFNVFRPIVFATLENAKIVASISIKRKSKLITRKNILQNRVNIAVKSICRMFWKNIKKKNAN